MKEYGIILDLDGTLWDSSYQVMDSWNERLSMIPYDRHRMDHDFMCSLMGKPMDEIAYAFFSDEPGDEALRLLGLCMEHELEYIRKHGGRLYDKVLETLAELNKKYRVFIVSNCQDGYIDAFLDYFDARDLISDYESFGVTGLQKADNIKLVMERNGLKGALYAGDTVSDMRSALLAGIPFVWASYGFGEAEEDKCSAVIGSFDELPAAADGIFGT
jgi:phosphoglycolate phosphatase